MSPGLADARFEAGQNSCSWHPKDHRCPKWKNKFNDNATLGFPEPIHCSGGPNGA